MSNLTEKIDVFKRLLEELLTLAGAGQCDDSAPVDPIRRFFADEKTGRLGREVLLCV